MPVDRNPCNASPGMPFCKLKVVTWASFFRFLFSLFNISIDGTVPSSVSIFRE
jgi:hypothetical protein